MRSLPLLAVFGVLTVCCAGCGPYRSRLPAPEAADMTTEALLAELNPRGGAALIQAWNGDDPEAVAAFYADDAVLVVNGTTVYRGRSEILRGFLRPLVGTIDSLTPTIDRVIGDVEQMTVVGRYTARLSAPNEPVTRVEGAFSNSWRRQPDGTWRIVASLNTLPMPAGSASSRRAAPGAGVRVVRFNVKADQRGEFERFFRENLRSRRWERHSRRRSWCPGGTNASASMFGSPADRRERVCPHGIGSTYVSIAQ